MAKVTKIIIGVVTVVLVLYDVYAIAKGGTEASISYVLIDWSYKHPFMVFLSGNLTGHLFWRVRNVKGTDKWGKESKK